MIQQKDIDFGGGCVFTIAAFSFDQMEDFLSTPVSEDPKLARNRAWDEVLQSVHNVPGQEQVTRQDISAKLSAVFLPLDAVLKFNELRTEVLQLNGYKLEKKQPGEVKAAPAS